MDTSSAAPPEHNVTGQDYSDRAHFRYAGPPIIDAHAHVMLTRPTDPPAGPPPPAGPDGSPEAAALMLGVAAEFGVRKIYTMCPADEIATLRARFGDRLGFNGMLNKKKIDDPDDDAYRTLDQFLEAGVAILKLWSAPRGRERGLVVDAPWRIEGLKRARSAGIKVVMVHVGDPDVWWTKQYADVEKFGTKPSQYVPLERMMREFPEFTWIGAHVGGDPEHPDHLEYLLEKYPNYVLDTSATKWQVREVSPRAAQFRALVCRHPTRFLFGSDLVTRHHLPREHYVSRYWCQRTLWESEWEGDSPIQDPDYGPPPGGPATPRLCGVGLPAEVLEQVYCRNAERLLPDAKP